MNDGGGLRISDQSGFGGKADMRNMETTDWTQGKFGGSLLFNSGSSNEYAHATSTGAGGYPFTLSVWINETNIHAGSVFYLHKPSDQTVYYGIFVQNGIAKLEARNTGAAATTTGSISISAGWHHIVGVFTSATDRALYVDGAADGTDTTSVTFDPSAKLALLGAFRATSQINNFVGSIDDARLYNRALTASEIRTLYQQGAATLTLPNNSGLVGYWKFDEATGTTVTDHSGFGNTGTTTKIANPATSTSGWLINGKFGAAMNFDGVDDIVIAKNGTHFDGTDRTVCAWVYPYENAVGDVANRTDGPGGVIKNNEWRLGRLNTSTGWFMRVRGSTGTTFTASTSLAYFTTQEWQHVCGVSDGGTSVDIYINGEERESISAASSQQTTLAKGSIFIGHGQGAAFRGAIDEVRIYNRPLAAADVYKLYKSGATEIRAPDNNGLVGYWSFEDGAGVKATDFSGTGNTGTLTNMEAGDWVAGRRGKALDFDGNNEYVTTEDMNAVDGASALTSCVWVRHRTTTTDDNIFAKNNGSTDGFVFFRDDVGASSGRTDTYTVTVYDSADTDSATLEGATGSARLNMWTFVCATFTAGSPTGLRLYVNGEEDANSPVSASAVGAIDAGANIFAIGMQSDGTTSPFDGQIDEARVYTRALTSAEIYTLYKGTVNRHY